MRFRSALFALLAAGLATACVTREAPANCGHKGVEVAYTHRADLGVACDALGEILAYFRRIGFDFEPRFSLSFADPSEGKPAQGVLSYGYVDLRSSMIVVYSSTSSEPWGLPWNRKLAGSFLRHELVHIAVWQILGREAAKRLAPEWHEFIAYAVQLDLMDPELRGEVLAKLPDVRAFAELSEVNEFTYGMNPDVFAVAAYLTYRERGAAEFVRRLLRGEITPPPFILPFPVLPEQNQSR
jgi:hypothetical protein